MVVLLTGSSGFIGRHLLQALLAAGHEVVCTARVLPRGTNQGLRYIEADFVRDTDVTAWLSRLAGVDAVINAVGILREHGTQTFDAIHTRAPRALFAACATVGVARVLQISALGADAAAVSAYHRSKKAADDFLATLPLDAVIVQPALVYGDDGTSARLFSTLASLPLIPLPGDGRQVVQPVHIDDVVAAVLALLAGGTNGALATEPERMARLSRGSHSPNSSNSSPGAPTHVVRITLLGPQALALRDFLARLRQAMGAAPARFIGVPLALVRPVAAAAGLLPGGLLDRETLQMLERGNSGSAEDVARMRRLLGRDPRPVEQFIRPASAAATRVQAQLNWLLPLLRMSLALVWIWTGIVSLGLYPRADSYALLARAGVPDALAPLTLIGAALLDIAFGVAILCCKKRRWLWLAQLSLIVLYSAVISVMLPEFWLHPYGPILKNLPMLAAIWLLLELENEGKRHFAENGDKPRRGNT